MLRPLVFLAQIAFIFFFLSHSAFAQTIYKCAGPDGKTAFSDRPCADGKARELVYKQSSEQGATLDVKELCKNVSPKDLRKAATCLVVNICEERRTPEACDFYCQGMIEGEELYPGSGVETGPVSKLCLSKTGRVRGANWVETSGKDYNRATNEIRVHFKCIYKNKRGWLEMTSQSDWGFCSSDYARCRAPIINDKNPEYLTLDALASKSCRAEPR